MEKDLSILTLRQRTAYLLREQGLTYKEIAAEMGTLPGAARQGVLGAQRRFRERELYLAQQEKDAQPMTLTVTCGELNAIVLGLHYLEQEMLRRVGGYNVTRDWQSCLPYRAQIVNALLKRIQMEADGKVSQPSLFDETYPLPSCGLPPPCFAYIIGKNKEVSR